MEPFKDSPVYSRGVSCCLRSQPHFVAAGRPYDQYPAARGIVLHRHHMHVSERGHVFIRVGRFTDGATGSNGVSSDGGTGLSLTPANDVTYHCDRKGTCDLTCGTGCTNTCDGRSTCAGSCKLELHVELCRHQPMYPLSTGS